MGFTRNAVAFLVLAGSYFLAGTAGLAAHSALRTA